MQKKENIPKYKTLNYKNSKVFIRAGKESSDFVTSGLTRGCAEECSYCYVKDIYGGANLHIDSSPEGLIKAIEEHVATLPWPKIPNHTHAVYYTYDIGAYSDIGMDYDYIKDKYEILFNFFRDHPRIMGIFSTKRVNYNLLEIDPRKKIRILFSLCTEELKQTIEPFTDKIEDRVNCADSFDYSGWSVGFALAPVVVYPGYMASYKKLFDTMAIYISYPERYMIDIKYLSISKKSLDNESNSRIKYLLSNVACQEVSEDNKDLIVYKKKVRILSESYLRSAIDKALWCPIRYIS